MFWLSVLFLATGVKISDGLQQDIYCDKPVDILILLDSSAYFGKQNFEAVKDFAKNFAAYLKLDIHKLGPHVALASYSDDLSPPSNTINFRYSSGVKRLRKFITSRLRYDGKRRSRLDVALRKTRSIIFQKNNGYRSWVPRVILAITGSWQTWSYDTSRRVQRQADVLQRSGYQLLIASVGDVSRQDRNMFESLVQSKDDVYMVRYVYGLMQVAKKMVQRLCPVPLVYPCSGIVDIAFIVDSSGSISDANYRKIKYFVYSIANALNISADRAHAGVVIYSTNALMVIKFDEHYEIASFQRAVYRLKHIKKHTRIDLGLKIAHSQLFSPVYGGARPGVKKLAFILTDGKQNPTEKGIDVSLGDAAKPLMVDNIKTLSIGIGAEVNKGELRAMVQYDEDVILAANFDELLRKIENITEQTCEEIISCSYPADIAFVLDSSMNVNSDDFSLQKTFVRVMAKLFRIFQHGSHGAVIVFGNRAELAISMNANNQYRQFIGAVEKLSPVGGARRTHKALERAKTVLSDYSGGARRNVPKVVLLLTAGPESNRQDVSRLKEVARSLHDRNVLVLVVGVGRSLITSEMAFMVQNSVNLFLAKSFTELEGQVAPLAAEACDKVGPGECDRKLDLAFILDSSGSITEEDFFEAKYFIQKLASTFSISPRQTRVALMIYSDDARIISKFGDIASVKEFNSKLYDLPHLKGKTRIDLALQLAGAELFTAAAGMRSDSSVAGMRSDSSVAKVAIVITDGRQTPAPDGIRLDEAVARLLYHDVKVLSVGIGEDIDQWELDLMVADPTAHSFWAESYSALRAQLATIARESCDIKTYTGRYV